MYFDEPRNFFCAASILKYKPPTFFVKKNLEQATSVSLLVSVSMSYSTDQWIFIESRNILSQVWHTDHPRNSILHVNFSYKRRINGEMHLIRNIYSYKFASTIGYLTPKNLNVFENKKGNKHTCFYSTSSIV